MPYFHTRPVVFEARQLTWESWQEVTEWCHGAFHQSLLLSRRGQQPTGNGYLEIRNGLAAVAVVRVLVGEWVVLHDGQFSRMTQEEFDDFAIPMDDAIEAGAGAGRVIVIGPR